MIDEPETAAGRRLIFEYRHWFADQGWELTGWDPERSAAELILDILAIEAEARAAAVAPYVAALRGQIVRHDTPDGPCWCWPLDTKWHEGWVHSPVCVAARALLVPEA